MIRITIAALVLVVATVSALAEDKVAKPIGTWVREAGEAKVTFAIEKDKLTGTVHTQNGDLVVEASYEATKDGELKAKVTKVVKNDVGGQIEEGHKFSFKFKIADGTLTISELKGNDENAAEEGAKNLVEGEYKKEKKEEKK